MTTKQYLGQIIKYNRMIDAKLEEAYKMSALACSMTVASDKENVKSSGSQDKLGDSAVKLLEIEEEINQMVDLLVEKRNLITRQIERIDDMDMYSILSMHYVSGKKLEIVFNKLGWSRRNGFYIYKNALNEFEKLFGDTYLSK